MLYVGQRSPSASHSTPSIALRTDILCVPGRNRSWSFSLIPLLLFHARQPVTRVIVLAGRRGESMFRVFL